ncbi:Protein of unknown function [Pseudonocardia thermophila]|jgi:Protein of unknown function (DUF3515).|uniref:DUF3515 domain-containing protein n=1 Tax=Pseudonocardia thermophila TaxID=1848 RepID=A0A1M6WPE7_PSETH|nr:DUF3515 domain-containing protein [Pseudonocardia thermophila]SHK95405.1 Protein of unknown function [Pseudonocardia thermophila]
MTRRSGGWSPPVVIAIALPVLFAVAVAVLGVVTRSSALDPEPVVETGPLTVVPVDAPAAADPACTTLLDALPATLTGGLAEREISPPVAGVRAWAAAPRPVVLRCGLPRPAELTPTSALLVVDGVSWLTLDDGLPNPDLQTHIAVDRPVFVAVTMPVAVGAGPLQEISEVIAQNLPAQPVPVR